MFNTTTANNPRPPSSSHGTTYRIRNQDESESKAQSLHLSQLVQHFALKDSQTEGLSEPIQLGRVVDDPEPVSEGDTPEASRNLNDNIPCQRYLHENLRAVWFCTELKRRVCYCCAEMLTDNGLTLVGGLPEMELIDEWKVAADPQSYLYQLNAGQEMILNLAMLRCPCGTPFQHSTQSAICSMCCTATCSASCHKKFVQDEGLCIYNLNFVSAAQPEVHGCRDIRWCVIERSPPATYLSRVCGPRYLEAITGPDSNTLLIRRGYGQYGQPLVSTIDAMQPIHAEAQRTPSIFRRNLCKCAQCEERQPHAVLHCKCNAGRKDGHLAAHTQSTVLPPLNPLSNNGRLGNPLAPVTVIPDAFKQAASAASAADSRRATPSGSRGRPSEGSGPPTAAGSSRVGSTSKLSLPDILSSSNALQQSRKITATKLAIEDEGDLR